MFYETGITVNIVKQLSPSRPPGKDTLGRALPELLQNMTRGMAQVYSKGWGNNLNGIHGNVTFTVITVFTLNIHSML